jgi:hypothetical protein
MKLKIKGLRTEQANKSLRLQSRSWMITDPAKQREAVEAQKTFSTLTRPPEVWIAVSEKKRFRFRASTPVACIYSYRVRYGDTWRRFTAPAPNTVDLFRSELGLKPSFRAIYEVIDYEGYEDRKGKKFKNVPRFFVANSRLYEQLETMREKYGSLTTCDIEIIRSGTGLDTTYSLFKENPTVLSSELKKIPSLKSKFQDYYAPPSEEQQQVIVKALTYESGNNPF